MAAVVQIDAWDPVANSAVTIFAGSHDVPEVCHLGGHTWLPAIAKLPTLKYDLFDGDFSAQIIAPSATIALQVEAWPDFGRYQLADARFRLWTGKVGDAFGAWTLRVDGRVTAQPALKDFQASIDFAPDDRWLDGSLLATYAGTSGAEGEAGIKGQVKPLAIGAPRYVAGVLIDSVNSIFQVTAYGAMQGFEAALEKLARFNAPVADYADYASLAAANLAAGTWATAKAVGMARLGAPPVGQISFLVQGDVAGPNGWARKPGQIIRRLALLSGGAGKIDDASLNALDAIRPYNLSLYLDQQTAARDLIQKLAASINAVAGVSWLGQLYVVPIGFGGTSVTLAADGSALPPVKSVEQINIDTPYKKLAIGCERAWTVHALADIAFTSTLVDLGPYDAGTTYREGNIVQSGGSSWLYINTTASAGQAPPVLPTTENAYWRVLAQQGPQGTAGTNGIPGPAGTSSFTWVAYADSANGAINFTTGAPGDRHFIGIASNQSSPNESNNPADYTWSQYTGPTGFGLIGSSVYVAGNKLIGALNTGQWNQGAYSTEAWIGGAQTTFHINAVPPGGIMAGLNTDPTTDNSYVSIDYAFFLRNDYYVEIWESGNYIQNIGQVPVGASFTIHYDGAHIRYLVNGNLARQIDVAGGQRFYFDSSFTSTDTLYVDDFSAAGPIGPQGAQGAAGVPGANGATLYTWVAYADSPDGFTNFTTGAPGGRGYQGIATNQGSSAESGYPGDYVWAPYRGPATFGLVPQQNVAVGPDYIVRTATNFDWNASAYSSEGYTNGASVSFTIGDPAYRTYFIGLNTDPTTDVSYGSIDYAFYVADDGSLQIWENGAGVQGQGTANAGSRCTIAYDGRAVSLLYRRCPGADRRRSVQPDALSRYLAGVAGDAHRQNRVQFGRSGW
ncbi:collagen-like domain-containing protein [Sphingomonas nostoxanthinifaciens]|uniref:hypothetical protein n=1 Tax=Sphingomonas nostoxanthinifaciens TaxID=2872652 RepID=UPI001CC216C1|nr:hypothetical protein [Sphingomonas nostoxanthinifaciens]UAK24341.1 hypothetical protein K8P63_18845 [Sphingomonas nostoxanthinifaciens]